ncbi:neutral alpha-glucosidase AB-like [Diaphorina citri]|uniref:Neutral alpha-glucosidase AB-like n=1 Tax=Diaphorina citri TaxID=121845 RepID=A0A3Q0J9M0_DIACI|nr:neutral alpha-glucosidase AB-like [Diaphorina citri]
MYRLYNLDVFEYELDSPMSLYAAIPFVTAHNSHHSVGVFWLNAAETWVDVTRSKSTLTGDVMSKIVNFVSGSGGDGGPRSSTEVRFMSESGE